MVCTGSSLSLTAVGGVATLHRAAGPSKNQMQDWKMVLDRIEIQSKYNITLKYIYFVVINFQEL